MELGIRHRYTIKQSHPSLDLPLYIAPLKLVLCYCYKKLLMYSTIVYCRCEQLASRVFHNLSHGNMQITLLHHFMLF